MSALSRQPVRTSPLSSCSSQACSQECAVRSLAASCTVRSPSWCRCQSKVFLITDGEQTLMTALSQHPVSGSYRSRPVLFPVVYDRSARSNVRKEASLLPVCTQHRRQWHGFLEGAIFVRTALGARQRNLSCLTQNPVKSEGSDAQLKVVRKELKDVHLLLARRPPSFLLDVLIYGRHLGVIPVASGTVPPLFRDRAASDQGPGHRTVLTGSSLHGGPQLMRTTNNARTATSVALGTPTTCQPGTSRRC